MAKQIPAIDASKTTCSYTTGSDNKYWYIYIKSSGNIAFKYAKKSVGVCIVGGGSGGAHNDANSRGAQGGAGGEVKNITTPIAAGQAYPMVIGSGGSAARQGVAPGTGTNTVAFETTARGGAGASGGAGGGGTGHSGAAGGTGTEAFGDSGTLYGGGGGGGTGAQTNTTTGGAGGAGGGGAGGGGAGPGLPGANAKNGAANTGGGGGGAGGYYYDDEYTGYNAVGGAAGAGGSGIVVIRGTEDDLLPVYFDNTQLSEIYFNGTKLAGLVVDGVTIFARRCEAWLKRWACRSGFRRVTPAL